MKKFLLKLFFQYEKIILNSSLKLSRCDLQLGKFIFLLLLVGYSTAKPQVSSTACVSFSYILA